LARSGTDSSGVVGKKPPKERGFLTEGERGKDEKRGIFKKVDKVRKGGKVLQGGYGKKKGQSRLRVGRHT